MQQLTHSLLVSLSLSLSLSLFLSLCLLLLIKALFRAIFDLFCWSGGPFGHSADRQAQQADTPGTQSHTEAEQKKKGADPRDGPEGRTAPTHPPAHKARRGPSGKTAKSPRPHRARAASEKANETARARAASVHTHAEEPGKHGSTGSREGRAGHTDTQTTTQRGARRCRKRSGRAPARTTPHPHAEARRQAEARQ